MDEKPTRREFLGWSLGSLAALGLSPLLAAEIPRRIPEGAEPWHSGMLGLDAGSEFAHAFRVPGVHDYFCQPHYSFGMVGRIVVDSAGDGGRRSRQGTPRRS